MPPITTDNDISIGYEKNSNSRKLLNSIIIPFLNRIPERGREKLRKTHGIAKGIIDNATTHSALEIVYGYNGPTSDEKLHHRFFSWLWQGTNNAKALRNRLRLVKKILRNELFEILTRKKEVHLLSIAAGSSRAFVEVLNSIEDKVEDNKHIFTTFLDKNPRAIDYSKSLTAECSPRFGFDWVNDSVGNYFRNRREDSSHKFDVIEMVGLMDYFEDKKATETFASIRSVLHEDGVLITANIRDNTERPFLTKAVGWNMIYREADHLSQLLIDAGFLPESLKVYYEPMRIHSVIIARKC